MPNDTGVAAAGRDRVTCADVAAAARAGLRASPKTLPASLFYDDEGCRLFYEITRLPEYYLTRTEMALLRDIAPELPLGAGGTLVEFGGSDETKARILLDRAQAPFGAYVSVDVAGGALRAMRDRLRGSHPGLRVVPVVGDFMRPLRLPPMREPVLGFFPGSTIGNLQPPEAVRFMAAARVSLGAGSWFLLGADLRKDPDVLLPAYDDAAGVTARFNLNLLHRLNREAAADFDPGRFEHYVRWNDAESRIEMHLMSRDRHAVHVAGERFHFAAGETIHTENSYKLRPAEIVETVRKAGWTLRRAWQDADGMFGIFLMQA